MNEEVPEDKALQSFFRGLSIIIKSSSSFMSRVMIVIAIITAISPSSSSCKVEFDSFAPYPGMQATKTG